MLEQILTGNPQQEVVNFLEEDSLLGNAKSKPLWPLQQQKLNMLQLQAAVLKIHTNDNAADLLTKAFDVSRFQFLVVSIGMINP
ncbi:hypothetical protein Tco_0081439 [Tanacetum coccineum]